jgi:hypothetical protein
MTVVERDECLYRAFSEGCQPRRSSRLHLYVVKPGAYATRYQGRCPGEHLLAKAPKPGDMVVDRLQIDFDGVEIHVQSEVQSESNWDFASDLPAEDSEGNRASIYTRVRLEARYAGQGGLGDDGYDADSAVMVLQEAIAEAVLGVAEWNYTLLEYQTERMPECEVGDWSYNEPVLKFRPSREVLDKVSPQVDRWSQLGRESISRDA